MDLAQLREQFVLLSGREDLIERDDDSGIPLYHSSTPQQTDFYINSGLRILEKKFSPIARGHSTVRVPPGEDLVMLQDLRALEAVHVKINETSPWLPLPKENYKLSTVRHIPDLNEPNSSSALEHAASIPYDMIGSQCVLQLSRKINQEMVLRITGLFWLPKLAGPTDTNWWTMTHPHIVVWASMYSLEVSYRNDAGSKAWWAHITRELVDIDDDYAYQESLYQWKGEIV